MASTHVGYTALGIIQAASETDAPLLDVASLYFTMGERLELDWFSAQILASKVDNEWQALARDTYLEDLEWQQRTLAVGALRHLCEGGTLLTCMKAWEEQEAPLLARWQEMPLDTKCVLRRRFSAGRSQPTRILCTPETPVRPSHWSLRPSRQPESQFWRCTSSV